jgi:hypothetical protein
LFCGSLKSLSFSPVDKLSKLGYFAIGVTCDKAARHSSKKVYKAKIEKQAYLLECRKT